MEQSMRYYATLLRRYWRATAGLMPFLQLLRVRLAQSKVGGLVCPSPVEVEVEVEPYGGPVVVRSHTTDISVNDELLVSDGYEVLRQHVAGPVRTVVDLGANTGLAARWMLHAFPEARVLAVEPEPGNVAVLLRNAEGRPIHVAPVAVGATVRQAGLYTHSGEHGFTIVGLPDAADRVVTVAVERLEVLLRQAEIRRVDLLKVDIEGAERELFSDCRAWIPQVDHILVECHAGFSVDDLLSLLVEQGADFRVVHREPKSEWGFEVALLASRATSPAEDAGSSALVRS